MSDIPVIMLAAMALAYVLIGLMYVVMRLCEKRYTGLLDAFGSAVLFLLAVLGWPWLCLASANGKDQGE